MGAQSMQPPPHLQSQQQHQQQPQQQQFPQSGGSPMGAAARHLPAHLEQTGKPWQPLGAAEDNSIGGQRALSLGQQSTAYGASATHSHSTARTNSKDEYT